MEAREAVKRLAGHIKESSGLHGCRAMAEDSLEGSSVALLSQGAGSYLGMEVV